MAQLRLTWALSGSGWADCVVSDDQAEAEVTASYITAAPEDLLTAVTRLIRGEGESAYRGKWAEHFPRAELEALRAAWRESRGDGTVR